MESKTKIMRFFNFLPSLAGYLMLIYVTLGLALCVLTSWFFGPAFYAQFTKLNLLFFVIALVVILLIVSISAWVYKKQKIKKLLSKNSTFHFVMIVSFLAILLIQLFIIMFILYMPVLDVLDITFYQFSIIDQIENIPESDPGFLTYFQNYTDRWFLTGTFLQIFNALNESDIANLISNYIFNLPIEEGNGLAVYFILQTISSIFVAFSCVMAAYISKKLSGNFAGYLTALLAFILAGLSPMAQTPYSDTYGMIFVVLTLFAYVCIKNRPAKCFIIVFASLIGYFIKPTAIAALAAILIIELCKFLGKTKIKDITKTINWKDVCLTCLSAFLAAIIVIPSATSISNFGFEPNEDKEFTYTHFLMMGANKDTSGQYSRIDEEISQSFTTKDKREVGNMEEWWNRVSSYGIMGNLKLLAKKTMTNYGCGNFMQPESIIFVQPYENKNEFLENFYNVHDEETEFQIDATSPYNCICQTFWIASLIGFIILLYKRKRNKYIDTMIVTLGFLSLFLLVAESSQRYLFIFLMYFIVLSSIGFKELCVSYIKFSEKRKQNFASKN